MLSGGLPKEKGSSFTSEALFLGKQTPGPGMYKIKDNLTKSKSPEWRFPKLKDSKPPGYKVKKSKEPDVGTYEGVEQA